MTRASLVVVDIAAVGCSSGGPSGSGAPAPLSPSGAPSQAATAEGVNEATVLASIANGSYKFSPQFTPVNRAPYASTVAVGAEINVWVTTSDFGSYSQITPEQSGSHVELSPGAMIVREVLDKGVPAKLTLMVKGPPGFNPDLGDFWFGVTEPNGTPLEENGARLTGKLTRCYGCHVPRKDDGFLFGVPAAAKEAPGAGGSSGGSGAGGTASDAGTPLPAPTPPPTVAPGPPPPPTLPPPPPPPVDVCGDFYCSGSETCQICPSDCGECGGEGSGGGGSSGGGSGGSGGSGGGSDG